MNCQDFESNINDLTRKHVMEPSLRIRALAHRDECEACARRLEDEKALTFELRALASETRSAAVPPLGNEVLAALRSNCVALERASVNSRWRYWAAGAAVAAMVLIVITVAAMRSATPRTVQGTPASRSNVASLPTPIAPAPDVVVGERPEPREDGPGRRRVVGKRSKNRLAVKAQLTPHSGEVVAATETANGVTPSSATEITTDFMPVGYANATNMQDGGQLVRVELPRSALVAFGLPMNVNRYNEKVKADVFFGADGMARAIRFVQ